MTEKRSDIGTFIREQREQAALSLRKLADQAGISNPYLSQIERGLRKPSAEILKSIANGLSLSAETLYQRAGLLDVNDATTAVEVAIGHDDALDESAKAALVAHYRSLVSAPEEENET